MRARFLPRTPRLRRRNRALWASGTRRGQQLNGNGGAGHTVQCVRVCTQASLCMRVCVHTRVLGVGSLLSPWGSLRGGCEPQADKRANPSHGARQRFARIHAHSSKGRAPCQPAPPTLSLGAGAPTARHRGRRACRRDGSGGRSLFREFTGEVAGANPTSRQRGRAPAGRPGPLPRPSLSPAGARLTSQAVFGAARRLPGPPSGSSPGLTPLPGRPHAVHGVGEHAGHRVEVPGPRPLHAQRELPGLLPGGRSRRSWRNSDSDG